MTEEQYPDEFTVYMVELPTTMRHASRVTTIAFTRDADPRTQPQYLTHKENGLDLTLEMHQAGYRASMDGHSYPLGLYQISTSPVAFFFTEEKKAKDVAAIAQLCFEQGQQLIMARAGHLVKEALKGGDILPPLGTKSP